MLADIGPELFEEWVAAHDLEPWGDDWTQAAQIIAKIHNVNTTQEGNRLNPADIIPTYENRAKTGDGGIADEMLASVWKTRLGAK